MATDQPMSMAERLAVMDTKLDILIEQRSDHEIRIRRLERWMWLVLGAGLAGGGAAGTVAAQLLR